MSGVPISVIITTYNAAGFIKETIESVLNQTFESFELLIGDDGSTDNTCEIVEKIGDPRIAITKCEHDFIGTENYLLYKAKGKYIARLDHDDVMLPDRLKKQYEYMELHPEIDVLGTSVVCFGDSSDIISVKANYRFTVRDFLKSNYIVNPSVIIRRSSITENNLRYNKRYLYADDYGLWVDMLKCNLHLENIPDILTKYRVSRNQTSRKFSNIQAESANKVAVDLQKWYAGQICLEECIPNILKSGKCLTVIIPFLNEGEEVVNTVKSIRDTVRNAVDIITINDLSTDGYPYHEQLSEYGVYYVFNKERKGVAASRDLGVSLCKTPYFLLLDGHMRFYSNDWCEILTSLLNRNDRCVLCCQGRPLQKEDGVVSELSVDNSTFGAYFPFEKGRSLVDIRWNTNEISRNSNLEPISAVLGAGYASSKRYWKYLKGLDGLLSYGSDESFISLKVWMEGGKCLLVKNVVIGHIYRKSSPFRRYRQVEVYNQLLISYLLFPQALHARNLAYFYMNEKEGYDYAVSKIAKEKKKWIKQKDYFSHIHTRDFSYIVKLQDYIASCNSDDDYLSMYSAQLHEIAHFLVKNIPERDGLFEGKMGVILWLSLYNSIFKRRNIERTLDSVWNSILYSIKQECLSGNFGQGLSGIGWALIFLYENGFVEDDIEQILDLIDLQVSRIDLNSISEYGIDKGVGGYIAYYAARLRYLSKNGREGMISKKRTAEMKRIANRLINSNCSSNIKVISFRLLLLFENGYDPNDMILNVRDWQDECYNVPRNRKYWTNSFIDQTMNTSYAMMRKIQSQKNTFEIEKNI